MLESSSKAMWRSDAYRERLGAMIFKPRTLYTALRSVSNLP
jgi:hypothetical protein